MTWPSAPSLYSSTSGLTNLAALRVPQKDRVIPKFVFRHWATNLHRFGRIHSIERRGISDSDNSSGTGRFFLSIP
ncbi:hypothetical protein P4S73_30225 [Paraglaciecola sp. Hal342]